jgi:hypothetical protein
MLKKMLAWLLIIVGGITGLILVRLFYDGWLIWLAFGCVGMVTVGLIMLIDEDEARLKYRDR